MSCRLIALLAWYEESPAWLAAMVSSLRGTVDHIVALDGAYFLFPESVKHPRSGREQTEAIVEVAHACNLGVTVVSRREPWMGNEVEKRNVLFRYGLLEAEPGVDWFLGLDADEVLTYAPANLRAQLADAEEDVATVTFWQSHAEHPVREAGAPLHNPHEMREGAGGHRVLFRALPDIRVEHAHYVYVAGPADDPRVLRGSMSMGLELAMPTDVRIEHRPPQYRHPARNRAKHAYYETRDRLCVERGGARVAIERVDGGYSILDAHGGRAETVAPGDIDES